MRTMLSRTAAILAITAAAAFGADNTIGTWKINLEKSTYSPAPMPLKSYTMKREAAPGGVRVTITGERTDGTQINASYTAKLDGSWTAVGGAGTPYNSVSLKTVDASNYIYNTKQDGGKYVGNGRIMVSKDLKSITIQGKGTDANGAPMTINLVLDKQ